MPTVHTPWETVRPSVERMSLQVSEADLPPVAQEPEQIPAIAPIAPASSPATASAPAVGGGLFTIPLLCLGIGIIACCVLIPAADENRRLVYERQRLQADLDQLTRQSEVNQEFLKRVADDPTLSERLAQRQMKMVRQGTSVLELKGQHSGDDMSPYELTTLPPPPEMLPYRPIGGALSNLCRDPHGQLYLMGAGLLLTAAGLVLGSSSKVDV